jgi:predicted phage-related endonuclease
MLAFLFCLCLAVVGVVGDLTDADFAKIGSLLTNELDKRDERLYTELGTLKSTIDALETKFDTLETKFDNLNSTVSAQIGDLKTYFTTAFPILTFSTAIALK